MVFPHATHRICINLFACFSAAALSACGGGGGGGGGSSSSPPASTYVKASFVDFKTVDGQKQGLGCLLEGPTKFLGCDQFGDAVALSDGGNVMVVGAPFEDSKDSASEQDNSILDSGAAYVFVRAGGVWSQQQYLKASTPGDKDLFGSAVAISGDGKTLAIGAFGEDSGADGINGDEADNTQQSAGAVYVFTRVSGTWTQQAYIKASDSAQDQNFGIALALNQTGDRLAVGASGAEAVYVFDRSGGSWSQQTRQQALNGQTGDEFGIAVDLNADGTILAVGAWLEDGGDEIDDADNSVNDAGSVHVFTRGVDNVWAAPKYLKASDIAAGNWFGSALAINDTGDRLVIGAPGENQDRGRAYVFERVGTVWQQDEIIAAPNTNSDPGDAFGAAVALAASSGDRIYVGARGEDSKAKNLNGQVNDEVDPDPALPYNNFDSGAVFEFRLEGSAWVAGDYIKATNSGGGDKFGNAVASNDDGSVFAVGAPLEDGPSTGINGPQVNAPETQAGAVYIFE